MSFADRLYVDESRLQSYAEQISSPVTFDKAPEYTAGIRITGPSVETRQSIHARPLTETEQINLIVSHLRKHRCADDGRVKGMTDAIYKRPFRFETCCA